MKTCKNCANRIKKVCVFHETFLIDNPDKKFPYFIKNENRLSCDHWELNPAAMYLNQEPEDWENDLEDLANE